LAGGSITAGGKGFKGMSEGPKAETPKSAEKKKKRRVRTQVPSKRKKGACVGRMGERKRKKRCFGQKHKAKDFQESPKERLEKGSNALTAQHPKVGLREKLSAIR